MTIRPIYPNIYSLKGLGRTKRYAIIKLMIGDGQYWLAILAITGIIAKKFTIKPI